MTPPLPILLTIQQYQYLQNRNRKILKLCLMKQKSQGQKQKRKSFIQSNGLKNSNLSAIDDILPKLDQTNLENMADSEQNQTDEESYDSDVHDVFQNFKEKARHLFADGNQTVAEHKEVLAIRNVKESELVINFKTANEPPSDFNNCQNEPKILISSAVTNPAGLKFSSNKASKEAETNNMQQKQSYTTLSNQNQQTENQVNFYPQQSANNFQPAYQNSNAQSVNYASGQMAGINQQIPHQQMYQNQINYQQNLNKHMSDQFVASHTSNMFQAIQRSTSPKGITHQGPNSQLSTSTASNNIGNTFTSMTQNSSNYNLQGLSSISNNLNSPSSANHVQNKKAKLSFMEYYYSVPNKSPSNILEKYMKRKK